MAQVDQIAKKQRRAYMRALAKRPRPNRKNPAAIALYPPPKSGEAAVYYARIVRGIVADLGGHNQIPTVLSELISNFGAVATLLRRQNIKIAKGKDADLDIAQYVLLTNALTKLGVRIGLRRVPKEIQSLDSYLADLKRSSEEQPNGQADQAEDLELGNAESD